MENVRKDIMYNKLNKKYGYLLDNINGFPLDKHQRKVVFCDKQNIIVIAGAGSGNAPGKAALSGKPAEGQRANRPPWPRLRR